MTSGDPRTAVILHDAFAFRRAAYLSLLVPWATEINIAIWAGDEGSTAPADREQPIALEIFVLGAARVEDPAVQSQLVQRQQLRPGVPLALISDHEDRAEVTAAFRHGASGFVPSSLEPDLARQAFEFILAGGTYFPSQILDRPAAEDAETGSRKSGPAESLTPRQLDVLGLLREGKSNKLIARDLSMCESTVKVHVRQIMRKLGAANRTQAALSGIGVVGSRPANATPTPQQAAGAPIQAPPADAAPKQAPQSFEHRDERRPDERRVRQGLQHANAR